MSTKVLVTGAQSQLARTLKEINDERTDEIQLLFLDKAELDLTHFELLQSFFKNNRVDYCVNCAAYTHVDQAELESDQAQLVNAEAVKHLADTCRKHQTVLIHISTDYVFDGKADKAYVETDNTNPLNEYGKSKLLGEQFIKDILEKHFIIRTSWLYSRFEGNFVNTIVENIRKKVSMEITSSQVGSPTSCRSLSNFILFLIENNVDAFGTYHFTDDAEISWFEFALEIAKTMNEFEHMISEGDSYITKAVRPAYSVLDNSKRKIIYPLEHHWKTELKEVLLSR